MQMDDVLLFKQFDSDKSGTWDLSRVRELSEWMRDDAYSEVLVGRVFVILGVKFAEMAMAPVQFSTERLLVGMQRPSNHSSNC